MKVLVLLGTVLLASCGIVTEKHLSIVTPEIEKRNYTNVQFVEAGIARNVCSADYDYHLLYQADQEVTIKNPKNKKIKETKIVKKDLVVCYNHLTGKVVVHPVKDIKDYKINTFDGIHD